MCSTFLRSLAAGTAHPAMRAGDLVAEVGLGWLVRRTFGAPAPAGLTDLIVGVGGEDGRRVGGIIAGALERAEGIGEGAGRGNVTGERDGIGHRLRDQCFLC